MVARNTEEHRQPRMGDSAYVPCLLGAQQAIFHTVTPTALWGLQAQALAWPCSWCWKEARGIEGKEREERQEQGTWAVRSQRVRWE